MKNKVIDFKFLVLSLRAGLWTTFYENYGTSKLKWEINGSNILKKIYIEYGGVIVTHRHETLLGLINLI